MASRKVGVVGLGNVGLCTAVCFAAEGSNIIGVDLDEDKVSTILSGRAPFEERELDRLLPRVLGNGRLKVTKDYEELKEATPLLITVGTPSKPDGSIDISYVKKASASIGKMMRAVEDYKLVVVKSTVVPGTTTGVVKPLLERTSGKKLGEFGLATNPEFLREGSAIEDTANPDRIIVGAADRKSEQNLIRFYRGIYGRLPATVRTTPANAELIKYASNSFLATKITFVNELANLCAKIPTADINVIARGMGLDRRIAPDFLRAGLGFGGSCFPKDVRALLRFANNKGVRLGVLSEAYNANQRQASMAVKLAERFCGSLKGKRVSILGLAFKPDSDDMREAVSLRLIEELRGKGARVVAYDPKALQNAKRILGNGVAFKSSAIECIKGTDCCIIATEWREFSKLTPARFKLRMRRPAVVDGRRVFDPSSFADSGVKFAAIGLSA